MARAVVERRDDGGITIRPGFIDNRAVLGFGPKKTTASVSEIVCTGDDALYRLLRDAGRNEGDAVKFIETFRRARRYAWQDIYDLSHPKMQWLKKLMDDEVI